MGRETVVVSREGPITVVTIDRPEVRNAVDAATAAALREAFAAFDADPGANVAVLAGNGGTFCAGADLKALRDGDRRPVADEGPGPMGPTRMTLGKPVFGVFCRRFGVPLVDLGTVRLPRLIGHARAMDLVLTGRAVDAKEAVAIGLVNRLAPTGGARRAAMDLAAELAALPQACLRSDRLSVIEQWGLSESDAAANEARRGRAVIGTGETLEGARRFAAGAGRGGAAVSGSEPETSA
jgi:enoyl-CoA hydratase